METILRTCKKCGVEKPLDEFVCNKGCNYGRTYTCRECNNKSFGNEYRKRLHSCPKIIIEKKVCIKCGVEKTIEHFHKKNQSKDGYSNVCVDCQALYVKNYKNTPRGAMIVKKGRKKYYNNNKYKWVEFRETERYQDYRNSPEYKKMSKESHDIYYKKNKKKINKQSIESHKRKKEESLSVKVSCLIRGRIHAELGRGKFGVKTQELIGCDFDFFIKYIESKFTNGMTWETHGSFGWHLDHIIPCSNFDLTNREEQKKCFHYTNYQPLWWKDNLSKGTKILIA